MSKEVKFNQEARKALMVGAEKLAKTVSVTLGAKGRNVAIDRGMGSTEIINDGVTVAKACSWEDPIENMGAYTLKEAAAKAESISGDGTTTCIVLAISMLKSGLKYIDLGANPMDLKRGMEKAVAKVIQELDKDAVIVSENLEVLRSVATISANNDNTIGEFIMDAINEVGPKGMITVQESPDSSTRVEVVDGLEFDRGYMSPYFITDISREICELDKPFILVTDSKITSMKQLVPILELVRGKHPDRQVLLLANDVDSIVLQTIVLNKTQGTINLTCVKNPGYGDKRLELTEDVATVVGATFISKDRGMNLEDATLDDLGYATKVTISRDSTKIIDGDGDEGLIEDRIKLVETQFNNATEEYDKGKLEERLGKLSGGVAVLYVGGYSDSEREEKMYRVEDALSATKAAIEEGIVPGGGVELLKISKKLESVVFDNQSEEYGVNIIKEACVAPFNQIIENAGLTPEVINNELNSKNAEFGYNVKTDKYVNMINDGIVDPVKVTKSSLTSAASVIGLLLTTEAVITETKKD